MDWNRTKHQSPLGRYSSPSTLQRLNMSPEFDQERGSYGPPPQLRRHGRVPSWAEEQRSHGRRHYDDSVEWSSDDDRSTYRHDNVPYPSQMPQHSNTPNGHRGRKSKKQVHYRSTPTVFMSDSASNDTRRHQQESPPAATYPDIAPEEEYFLNHPDFARSLVDDLIEDTMEDELIPDIIEDILRLSLLTPLSEPEEVWSPRTTLTFDLVDELVMELAMEEGVAVVRESLRELVSDYMQTSKVEDELVKVSDLVEKRLSAATEEEVVEDYIGQEVSAGAQEVAVEVLRYYTEKKRTHEIKKVEQYAVKKMVDTACLDKLLSIITGLGAVEVADEFGDRPLDDMILTILLDQYMDVYAKQKSTLDNAPLKRWHKNLVADVALDLLLDELCNSLDEDLADLDEYEISFDSRPTDDIPHILTDR